MSASSIARSSVVMAVGTLMSRILGLVRNALLIAALGATASGAADAFNVANMLPTQLYNLIIGGVLNAILVPQIVRAMRQQHGEELVNRLLTAAAVLIAAVSALLTIAAPVVIMLYASGLGRWQPLAFAFAFWCMPQVFFYGLYALWGQVLNARHSFGPYMWAPVLNNIISIASILAYLHLYGGYSSGQDPSIWDLGRITLIGGCATLGIALQAVILYIPLRRSGFRPRFVWGVRGLGLGGVSKVALWALLGSAIISLGDLAVTNLGSRAVSAAESPEYAHVIVPSTTMYANALLVYMLPQSLVTTSIITALFTRMSEKAAAGDRLGVRDDLSVGLRSVAVFTVLFAAGIMTLSSEALQFFVPSLTREVADASAPILSILAVGIVFQGAWFTAQRVMLAYADTKRLLIAECAVGAIAVSSCVAAWLLAPPTMWMALAAAGNMVSLAVACVVIVPLLRRHLPSVDGRRVMSTHVRLVVAGAVAVMAGMGLRRLIGPADGTSTGTRAGDALVIIVCCALVMTLLYLAVARVLRVSELDVLFRPLARIVLAIGARLPGGLGRAVCRMGAALPLAARSSRRAGTVSGRSAAQMADGVPGVTSRAGISQPRIVSSAMRADRIGSTRTAPTGRVAMSEGTPIGSGRYQLHSVLPTTLPRMVSHRGQDTILAREVTILSLTDATAHRDAVLDAAARAVLVDDERMQQVYDVERGSDSASADAFIVIEPADGTLLSAVVHDGLAPAAARALIGEVAQVLDACSRRDLHHLALSPDSVRVRPDGRIQVCGVGIEAALSGRDTELAASAEPLAADRADARALVELLYFSLTGRWPGKRPGIAAAPMHEDGPAAPSSLTDHMTELDADLDALVARTWGENPPVSAREVASVLEPWDIQALAEVMPARVHAQMPQDPVPSPTSHDDDAHSGSGLASGVVAGVGATLGHVGATMRSTGVGVVAAVQSVANRLRAGRGDATETTSALSTHPSDGVASGAQTRDLSVSDVMGRNEATVSDVGEDAGRLREHVSVSREATEIVSGSSSESRTGGTSASAQTADVVPAAERRDATPARTRESRAVRHMTGVVIALAVVGVLVGVFFAVSNLLDLARVPISDKDLPAAKTLPTQAAAPSDAPAEAVPITVTGAVSLDPFGDNNEHPELAGALIDGDPATEWYSRYYAASSLSWKQGLGVALTFDQTPTVSHIDIQGTGEGGHVQIRATSPDNPTGGTLVAEGIFTSGTTSFDLQPVPSASLVIWVTELPVASDGLLKVTISDIHVR